VNSSIDQATDGEWHRISPIAILYYIAKVLKGLSDQVIYMVPAALVFYKTAKENFEVVIPLALLLIALLLAFAVASFLMYRYRLTEDTIEIRSGVFQKTQSHLPFERIQNIRFEQPIYYRISDYCCMKLDTAGSSKNEAQLIAIKMNHAISLKAEILSGPNTTRPSEKHSDEELLCTRSVADLIIHGLTNNRMWILLGAAAPFYEKLGAVLDRVFTFVGLDMSTLLSVQSQGIAMVIATVVSLALFFMMLIALISVGGSLLTYYDYRLTKSSARYIRRSGLLTKHQVAFPLRRLQSISYKQDWLDLLLGRVNLVLEQNQTGVPGQPTVDNTSKLIVPSVYPEQAHDIAIDAMPGTQLNKAIYLPINRRFIVSKLLYILLPLAIIASAITGEVVGIFMMAATFVAILSAGGLLTYLRWRRWGYAFDDNYIYVRKGLFGVTYSCFERHKLQQVTVSDNWFLRRRNLSNLTFVLASGSLSIPCVSQQPIESLVDQTLSVTESSGKSWM